MTSAEKAGFDLERFIPFRLSILSSRMTSVVARVYTNRFKLLTPEWRAVAVLGRFGGMTASEVAERTAMDNARVSRTVTKLLRSGHLVRRSDPLDRRRALLDLTDGGRELYAKIVPLVLAAEAELLKDLTEAERAALDAAFGKLEARLEKRRPKSGT
jgi:DNA-binding MarR family transcriptional regulator